MKKVFVDPSKCTGCKSCEIACAVEHSATKDLYKAIFEIPRPMRFDTVLKFDDLNVSLRCAHCEDAPCVNICPTGALFRDKDTDLVTYNFSNCIGCWQCAMVCPFGAIYPDMNLKVAKKCDGCIDRIKAGEIPACVEACPTNALIYADATELEQYKKEKVAEKLTKGAYISELLIGV